MKDIDKVMLDYEREQEKPKYDLKKIDALVAEHVMGFKPYKEGYKDENGFEFYQENVRFRYPKYSTNIADAWEILEKLRLDKKYSYNIELYLYDDACECVVGNLSEMDTSMPKAICLAALKAKGVDIDE